MRLRCYLRDNALESAIPFDCIPIRADADVGLERMASATTCSILFWSTHVCRLLPTLTCPALPFRTLATGYLTSPCPKRAFSAFRSALLRVKSVTALIRITGAD